MLQVNNDDNAKFTQKILFQVIQSRGEVMTHAKLFETLTDNTKFAQLMTDYD